MKLSTKTGFKKNRYAIALLWLFLGLGFSYFIYASQWDIVIHKNVTPFAKDTPYYTPIQDFWGLASRMGQDWFQICVSIAFGVFYYKKCHYQMSRLWYGSIVVSLLAGLVGQIIKFTVGRPRPKLLPEYDPMWFETVARYHSWPSGHTITTFAWLACLLPFYPKKVQVTLVALACLISFSRVGIGAHYMSDVLSGAVLGYVVGMALRERFKLGKNIA